MYYGLRRGNGAWPGRSLAYLNDWCQVCYTSLMKEKTDKVHDTLRDLATRWSAIVQAANKPVKGDEATHNRKQLKIIQDLVDDE